MADDDGVIVAGGDAPTEFLAILGFKILAGGNEDICRRIELQKLSGPLLCQVVGHHKEGFLAQAQPFALHGGSNHLESLARTHCMC